MNGNIVNIASIVVDNVPPPKMLHYTMAKSALVSFTKSLATEFGPKGIHVNCISPGLTITDMTANFPEKAKLISKMGTTIKTFGISGRYSKCSINIF